MRRSRPFLGRLSLETSFKNLTMVVDIDTNTSAFVTSRIEAVAPALTPGLSCVVDFNVPDQNSSKIELTRFNGGFSSTWDWDGRIVSLTLEEKCRLVKGHYYHPFSNYTIGAEWCFNVARRRSTLSFGAQLHFGGV